VAVFNKRYHPPGTPPGTLRHASGEDLGLPLTVTLCDYDSGQLTVRVGIAPGECAPFLSLPTTTWIHVQGRPDAETLIALGKTFGLHSLVLEDILNSGQRPKVESYEDQLFVVMGLPQRQDDAFNVAQASLILLRNFVISFTDAPGDPFTIVRDRLRDAQGHLRRSGADFLLYSLMDVVIDDGFPTLEQLGERLEEVEDALLALPTRETLAEIHRLKRQLLVLRRIMWPHREILNALQRDMHPLLTADTRLYLRDCYDHTVQIMELLETYREMATEMLDVYLSSASNRLNEIMRVLTMIATIFIPLTFLVGVYGMNFGMNGKSPWAMPELDWYYGYPGLWIVMIIIAVGMLLYFKRKGWF
jgi:magnesium transporter